jgi:DNA polymerase IV
LFAGVKTMKILCILLPHFPLMCEVRDQPEIQARPAVVTRAEGSQKLVLDFSPGLADLQPGMSLQQALARYGEARLLHADLPRYWSVFDGILDALEERSPLVEGTGLGCAYVGLDGLQLIYPDDDALVAAMRQAVPTIFSPRLGMAGNKFLAYLAARRCPSGGHQVLPDADAAAFLRELPCDVLPVSVKIKSRLHDFGIDTLGQLAAMPPGPLQAQFGEDGRRMASLARGRDDTPLYPRGSQETIEESAALASVTVSLEAILVAVEELLARAMARDGARGRGIRGLTLWTRTWGAGHWERSIQFKEPAIDIRTAVTRIRQVLESYPQPGPVEQVGLKITGLGYPRGRQRSLFSRVRAKDHLMDDIRQLEFRLGNPQVFTVKEVEPWSRIPERRYALMPANR